MIPNQVAIYLFIKRNMCSFEFLISITSLTKLISYNKLTVFPFIFLTLSLSGALEAVH